MADSGMKLSEAFELADADQRHLARLMFIDLMAQVVQEADRDQRLGILMFNQLMALAFPEETHR